MADSSMIKQETSRYLLHNFTPAKALKDAPPKIISRGKGSIVWDIDGKRYIDGMGVIQANHIGHCRKEVIDAIVDQLNSLEFYHLFGFSHEPSIQLAKKIASIAPGDMNTCFFTTGGGDANEAAIKIARQYHRANGQAGRYKVIYQDRGYHGMTFGALSADGNAGHRYDFEPLLPGYIQVPTYYCYRCSFGLEYPTCGLQCAKAIERVIQMAGPGTVSAVMVEPVMGAISGYIVPPNEYLQAVRQICDKYGALLILDEVVTAFGRTGKMFGCDNWKVIPDLMAVAKGLTSAYLPIGAVIMRDKIAEVFYENPVMHGHTFGGHPVSCAAALANLEIIEKENLVDRARDMGAYILGRLKTFSKFPIVGEIRGIGMLFALEIVQNKETRAYFPPEKPIDKYIFETAYNMGLICRNENGIMVLCPPLVITKPEADEMVDILEKAIDKVINDFELLL